MSFWFLMAVPPMLCTVRIGATGTIGTRGLMETELVVDGVTPIDREAVAELDADGGAETDGVVEGVTPTDRDAEGELVPEGIGVTDADVEGEDPNDSEDEGVTLSETVGDAEAVFEGDIPNDSDGVGVTEGDKDVDGELLAEGPGVPAISGSVTIVTPMLEDEDGEAPSERVTDDVMLAEFVVEIEAVLEGLRPIDSDGEALSVRDPVGEFVGESNGPEADGVVEALRPNDTEGLDEGEAGSGPSATVPITVEFSSVDATHTSSKYTSSVLPHRVVPMSHS